MNIVLHKVAAACICTVYSPSKFAFVVKCVLICACVIFFVFCFVLFYKKKSSYKNCSGLPLWHVMIHKLLFTSQCLGRSSWECAFVHVSECEEYRSQDSSSLWETRLRFECFYQLSWLFSSRSGQLAQCVRCCSSTKVINNWWTGPEAMRMRRKLVLLTSLQLIADRWGAIKPVMAKYKVITRIIVCFIAIKCCRHVNI